MPVARYWTSYWKEESLRGDPEYEPVQEVCSSSFGKRGVKAADVIYIVSQHFGQLVLGGRMTVGSIVPREEAVRIFKKNDLYDVDDWVIGEPGSATKLHHHRQLDPAVTKQLRFLPGQRALEFVNDRDLDRQTISRAVRELTTESASLLDEIIEMTDDAPRSPAAYFTISNEQLRQYRSGRDFRAALHEEIQDGVNYVEGSVSQVLVNRYERDPGAREACIRHHGAVCKACGFDFRAAYGEVAAGFIHVHHLIPLSSLGKDYVVNPVDDLRPVCPNCHAVIHRRSPPYSLEAVQRFVKSHRPTAR